MLNDMISWWFQVKIWSPLHRPFFLLLLPGIDECRLWFKVQNTEWVYKFVIVWKSRFRSLWCTQSLWICIETDRPQESSTSQFCSVGFKENWVTKRVMNPGENACLMEWPICWMTPKQIESIVSTPLLKFFLTSSMEKVLYTIPSNTIRVFAPRTVRTKCGMGFIRILLLVSHDDKPVPGKY